MAIALKEAEKALNEKEVPVGAVVVRKGELISKAHNTREKSKNALHHAEVLAINEACKKLGGWRLWECEMYITMEPCPMCAGAIVNSRIPKIYFGAYDDKYGACGSTVNLLNMENNFKVRYEGGFEKEKSLELFESFFKYLREKH